MLNRRVRLGGIVSRGTTCAFACAAALLAALAGPAPAAEVQTRALRDPEVTTNASGANTLRIEFRPASMRFDTVIVEDKNYLRVVIDEGVRPSPLTESGSPDLPWRHIPLAFPAAGAHTVRVVAADFEELRGVTVLPVPSLKVRDGYLEPAGYAERRDIPSGNSPETVAQVVAPAKVRSAWIGAVRIWPAQYDAGSRTLRKYSRIVVEVTFAGGPRDPVRSGDATFLANAVANPDMLRNLQSSADPVAKTAATPSVLATGDWYRLSVTEEGIYRIDAAYLTAAGITAGSVDPRTIKIYGSGGKEVPENVSIPRPSDLVENAIYVEGESDGQMGAGDYILFYGRGTRGLSYDSAGRAVRHYINHYSDVNYYWLTFGGAPGKRMQSEPSLAASPDVVVERFGDAIFIEDEKVNVLSSGKDWLGQSLSGPSGSFTYVNILPGLVPNDVITYRYSLVAHDGTSPQFTVRDGGNTLGIYSLAPSFDYLYATGNTWQALGTSSLSNNTSQLNIAFSSPSNASEGWIDWIEILFPRMLWGVNNYLRFRSPDTTGVAEFRLQQFSALPMIFDVTDYANVKLITEVSGSYTFRAALTGGSVSEYCAAGSSAWKNPAAIQKMANQDLRGYADGADFIIVTSSEFRAAAEGLKAYRERPEGGGLKTFIVDVAQIYNEFSGGVPDVSAIRDYLKYAYTSWTPQPRFVLFFGGASYDYKGILGSKSAYVPTWQTPESRHDVNSYATDDFFTAFGSGMVPSLVSGRISSRTVAEANTVVDKIIRYENQSARDSWKTRMLIVGDDAWTSELGEVGDRTEHSDDAETLARNFTPEEFEKKKIYLAEYPTVYTSQGRRKPGASQDIIDNINQGVLMVNYSGHGNPKVWAHELVFEVTTSIPQLTNADRLSVFFLATCNFSQFDDPKNYTGSELLMNKPDGGASGVISASRKVYASGNAALNQGTYRRLFLRDPFNRIILERPATALFLYKASGFNYDNDQKFFFMGDPTMRLAFPRGFASIDSINGQPVDSVNGAARTTPITLKALSHVTVAGTVRDAGNSRDAAFTGTLTLRVNDVSRQQTIVNFYPGFSWQYQSSGATIYKGENSVTEGGFRASFVVPKDISYADTTGRGRLVAYVSRTEDDGAGFTSAIRINGTDSTAVTDGEGPTIRIALENRSFRPGDVVGERPTLIVDLSDSNGINTSTAGIGHRIEGWINNSVQSVDLTEYYTSKRDDFREGAVQLQLSDLPLGRNTIRVRAWDSYNNSASAETYFVVQSSERLSISDMFDYPNPFGDETQFTFRQNQQSPLDVEIKVYTIAGRLVQQLHSISVGEMMVRVPWDGRDREGDKVANGVYLYKTTVRTMDGRFASEAIGRLAIVR